MLDRDQLETFATVAEQQSFERAAQALNITRGAVSQRIKALEESLSTVLLLRDKPIAPTPSGEILLRHVKALRMLEGAALRELMPPDKSNIPVPLAIAVNADSLATWFPPVLQTLLLERRVALEVVTDDQDYTSARLSRGEVVGCISTDAKAAAGFVAEALGAMEYRCYASPGFAREFFPDGLTVPAVLAAPAVLFNRKDSLHDEFLSDRFGFSIQHYARHYLPSPASLLQGIVMGVGYGLVPRQQALTLMQDRQLIDVAPDQPAYTNLYWHHWEVEPLLSCEITELVVREARRQLVPITAPGSFPSAEQTSGTPAIRSANFATAVIQSAMKTDAPTPAPSETASAASPNHPDQPAT
ncbi:MAG TPA: HTH-type transcriptional regulator ArgP [Methylibium sp.]|uniref:HTH-type transcriptional regulator ArgP n=1 Tax=Methylibium sp. TaxID=2067992 RepID=UPI002DB9EA61|nr:HTH-type transcriptional regulator ArgP [Methylibium sp.]HEU4459993.1 HTH-type transcriptional regulator ArgP [Methylibium sp.]